ncbi:trehalose-phosphatase [Methylocella tundrae]|uniref:trehalose-phosphatase n=1 Tax=Methylocella tundrae TaxID=227605 RepID=UPI00157AC503
MVALSAAPRSLLSGELARLAPPRTSAYFLDVDGTLLEIRPRPEDVAADAFLRTLLQDVAGRAGAALALVSGRKIDDLDRIFEPLVLPAAGLHGAEIRFVDGSRIFAHSGVMDAARPKLRAFAELHPGLRLEDKGATLALHFRQRPELADEVLTMLESVADSPGLAVQPGKMVAELKQSDHTKATAVEALLASAPFAGRTPVFIGDDLTDESGFVFVNARGGISIRVGAARTMTAAQFRVGEPAELRAELEALKG